MPFPRGGRDKERVGSVRPSQLLWTYGPGATIDLPNFSVMTGGLDDWDVDSCVRLGEARLLEHVRRILGPQVESLRQPPICEEESEDIYNPASWRGVPVKPFPRWFRCVKCGLMARYDDQLFDLEANPYRPERTRFVHSTCPKGNGRPVDAVPVRFLAACRHGHLDEFPWKWFVHDGKPEDCPSGGGPLYFFERGASLQTENLWVRCEGCGKSKSLATAYGTPGRRSPLPGCRGHHPHLGYGDGAFEPCDQPIRPILLGATNCWFPQTVSVLAIPTRDSIVAQLVADNWGELNDIEDEAELKVTIKTWKKAGIHSDFAEYDISTIWAAIEKEKQPKENGTTVTEEDVKVPEWKELTSGNPIGKHPEFVCHRVDPPPLFRSVLSEVVLLDRLRKVNALVGFTRLDAPDSFGGEEIHPAPLCVGRPKWVPACEVFGEGIFLRFDETSIAAWESKPEVRAREERLRSVYVGWRKNRGLDPAVGFPGIRYYLLHTLSHLVIRELALECGYNAASIQERVYAQGGDTPMAGILVYTAASDSDGTLGGLVSLGEPDTLERILRKAIERAKTCSSDPLCSEHMQDADWSLHAAACHACSFVAETTCESGNRYLDRALVVPTYSKTDVAFFP